MAERPITFKVDSYEKSQYQHWSVDHAEGNMSAALSLFVRYLTVHQPTWKEVVAALDTLHVLTTRAGETDP